MKIIYLILAVFLTGCPVQSRPDRSKITIPTDTSISLVNNGVTRLKYPNAVGHNFYYSEDPDNNYHWYTAECMEVPNEPLGHKLSDFWRSRQPPVASEEGKRILQKFAEVALEAE